MVAEEVAVADAEVVADVLALDDTELDAVDEAVDVALALTVVVTLDDSELVCVVLAVV